MLQRSPYIATPPQPPEEDDAATTNQEPRKGWSRGAKITAGVAGLALAIGGGYILKETVFKSSRASTSNNGPYDSLDDAAISDALPGGVKDPNAPLGDSYTSIDSLTTALTEETNAEDTVACATDLFSYPQLLYYGPDMTENGIGDASDLRYVADSHKSADAKVRTVTFQTDIEGNVLANLATDTRGIGFVGVDINGSPLNTPGESFLGRDCRGIEQPGGGIGAKYGSNNNGAAIPNNPDTSSYPDNNNQTQTSIADSTDWSALEPYLANTPGCLGALEENVKDLGADRATGFAITGGDPSGPESTTVEVTYVGGQGGGGVLRGTLAQLGESACSFK